MKRLFCIMTAMILMLGLIPAAGTAETVLTEVRNDAQGFTTRMPEGKTATVNDQGQLNIWLEGEGFVPNVWICRRSDKVDPDKLLYESYPAYLKDKFGDRLLDVSASGKTLEIGGKILPAVAFIYADIHGNTVYRINLMEVRDDGDVEYICPHCGERYVPAMRAVWFAPHIGRSRLMKCPRCGKRGYHRKVMTK